MSARLSESDKFVLLAKRRRRLLLRILRDFTTPLTPAELASHVGDREHGDPSADGTRAVYLALYHNHLPRLEEADVVVYDGDGGPVQPGLNFDALVRFLEAIDEEDLDWSAE